MLKVLALFIFMAGVKPCCMELRIILIQTIYLYTHMLSRENQSAFRSFVVPFYFQKKKLC